MSENMNESEEKVVDILGRMSGEKRRAAFERRTGWAGLSEEEASRPGAELLAMLYQRANEDGLQLKELAAVLGVTYGYLHQLKSGMREVAQVSDDFLAACARYLNKPKLYVQALAGKLNLADFSEPASLEGELDTALSVMHKDPEWGGFMPLSFKTMGTKERLFLVKLYEAATNKVLLPKVTLADLDKS